MKRPDFADTMLDTSDELPALITRPGGYAPACPPVRRGFIRRVLSSLLALLGRYA